MNLTKNFTLRELTASAKADELGIVNSVTPGVMPRLQETAEMLQRCRDFLGSPLVVTSGYRCDALNRCVGGVTSSDHTRGEAADVISRSHSATYLAGLFSTHMLELGIGQVILEGVGGKQWVHLSTRIPDKAVNRVLTITAGGVRPGIQGIA